MIAFVQAVGLSGLVSQNLYKTGVNASSTAACSGLHVAWSSI